jgi:hypothetical protein
VKQVHCNPGALPGRSRNGGDVPARLHAADEARAFEDDFMARVKCEEAVRYVLATDQAVRRVRDSEE